jgi:hypothetical protein
MPSGLTRGAPSKSFLVFLGVLGAPRGRGMLMEEGTIRTDCRLGPVAGERGGRVTGRVEASRRRPPWAVCDLAGRNVSESRASLESEDVAADPLQDRGRLLWMGKQPMHAPVWSTGVVGTARRKSIPGNVGDPILAKVASSTPSFGRRPNRESERGIVPSMPGNAGGGKAPCFWCACKDGGEGDWR